MRNQPRVSRPARHVVREFNPDWNEENWAHRKKEPQLWGKPGPKSMGRNNAEIGMAMMWIRNRPTSIKFRFRERCSDLLVIVDGRRPHGTLSTPGWAARFTNWLRTYLIDDTEPGCWDDTLQTVFPTSSAISSPPVRSTAKPTGLPRA
jgi:hypothetical protein